MTNSPLITAASISRYYGQRLALDNICFTIHRGEIVCFLGPNGAGKSTLMQIICGVMAASSGAISIAGFDIIEQPLQAKQHLGYLPEQPPVYPDCTVDEYLAYSGRLRGIQSNRLVTCIDTSKQKCGLTEVGKRLIGNLSKGYQQRIGIAQALIHEPAVIILDEPSSGVDPNQMIEIRELIREMGKHHSIILSTHMLAEAETTCDRVLILQAGTVVLDSVMTKLTQPLEQTYLQLTGTAHSTAKAQTA